MNALFHGNVRNTAMLNRKGTYKKTTHIYLKMIIIFILFLVVRFVKFVQHL
jgi:hypothetical protein